jgi:uncharacterized membrane protein (UPF0127 family)
MLINARTGAAVAHDVEIADTRAARRKGLLGRDRLDRDAALLLTPCFAIHTAYMRFAIDAIFVDRYGFVVRVVHDLAPWRMAISTAARTVVELPAGTLRAHDVRVGDHLHLVPTVPRTDGQTAA